VTDSSRESAARVVWSVSALLFAASDALAARFGACTVRGELSGFTRAGSGHCYFQLKDADGNAAALRCAMFRRAASMLDFQPRDGEQVELRGRVAVYEARGELQFVAEAMQRVGAGTLYEQFLRLKEKLQSQGLFDPARKRPLPAFPTAVGVVTSLGAAALTDVASALARRAPHVRVVVYPSVVQGPEAPAALVDALALAARRREVDTIILCRGGGSLQDLWAFNDERVVRAVAASPIPVVCGVGHESDVSLADFAADLRAATPTAAAELAAPSRTDALAVLAGWATRAHRRVAGALESHAQRLDHAGLLLARPAHLVARHALTLRHLDSRRCAALAAALRHAERAPLALAQRLFRAGEVQRSRSAGRLGTLSQRTQGAGAGHRALARARLETLAHRLAGLDPRRVLSRGYAWVTDAGGTPVVSARSLEAGQSVQAVWQDGSAVATVQQVRLDP
jgi:exodeoxyribonuclease VII large subunit